MSRYLASALGEQEAKFKHAIMALERRHNHPNHDLHLVSKIFQQLPKKIQLLGLDPTDTTTEELYQALNNKLKDQDQALVKKIRTLAANLVNAEANVIDGVTALISSLNLDLNLFVLKTAVLKSLLRASPPKKVIKILGLRSVESMLKNEPLALILVAINYYESEAYVSNLYNSYKQLKAANFENRQLNIVSSQDQRWLPILKDIKKHTGLSVVSSYELGFVVILPIDNQPPVGYLTLLITNLLTEMAISLSVSSYLKLHQVSPKFGLILKEIVDHEPQLNIQVLNSKLSWQKAQMILAGHDTSLFAPHLSNEDFNHINLLDKLASCLEEFKYWQDTEFLAHIKDSQVISFNIKDVATNLANRLPFNERSLVHFRHSLVNELTSLYCRPETVIDYLNNQDQIKSNQVLTESS